MSDASPHLDPPSERRCRFHQTNGARSTVPPLDYAELCFDHHRRLQLQRGRHRAVLPSPGTFPLVNFAWAEDHHSILFNLNQIAHALPPASSTPARPPP